MRADLANYPTRPAHASRHLGQYSGIEMVCHALDIMLPAAKLLAQIRDIADKLVTISPAA
jgi:hypothetical protein